MSVRAISRGESRTLSGRGAGFQKIGLWNIYWPFFTKLILSALLTHYKDPILIKLSAPQAKFKKKQAKKAFLDNFWEILIWISRFFGALSPLKFNIYIGAKGAFRKCLGTKNGYLKGGNPSPHPYNRPCYK